MNRPFFKRLIFILSVIILVAFCVQLNDVAKPQLVNTQGRAFERATVTEIVRDNLQENGSRIGDQIVRLRLEDGLAPAKNMPASCWESIVLISKLYPP